MAAACSATLASAIVCGGGGDSIEVEEAIEIPVVKDAESRRAAKLRASKTPDVGEFLQCAHASLGPGQVIAVDEEMPRIVEQLRARVQAQAAARGRTRERKLA